MCCTGSKSGEWMHVLEFTNNHEPDEHEQRRPNYSLLIAM